MSFLGNKELIKALSDDGGVKPFKKERVDAGKYELSLGNSYYSSDLEKFEAVEVDDQRQIVINPGQFALLITKEEVSVSPFHIGFISIKAGIKFRGLVNISGFHVDPGFRGRLKFSVYNAGTNKINLTVGEALFQYWLATVTSHTSYDGSHQNQKNISSNDLNNFMQGQVASPAVLKKEIDDLRSQNERNQWFVRIIAGILIALLIGGLVNWIDGIYSSSSKIENQVNTQVQRLNIDSLVQEAVERKVSNFDSMRKGGHR